MSWSPCGPRRLKGNMPTSHDVVDTSRHQRYGPRTRGRLGMQDVSAKRRSTMGGRFEALPMMEAELKTQLPPIGWKLTPSIAPCSHNQYKPPCAVRARCHIHQVRIVRANDVPEEWRSNRMRLG